MHPSREAERFEVDTIMSRPGDRKRYAPQST